MGTSHLTRDCQVPRAGTGLLDRAAEQFSLSARGYERFLKVARTIADLAGCEHIDAAHVAEALQYRLRE